MQKRSNVKKMHVVRKQPQRLQAALGNLEDAAKRKLLTLQSGMSGKVRATKKLAQTVNRYGHKKPWRVAGAVSVASLLIGFLMGFRRASR